MLREITISPVLNGFVCRIGCQSVVFQSRANLIAALDGYFAEHDQYEREFVDRAIHKDLMGGLDRHGDGECDPRYLALQPNRSQAAGFTEGST